MKKMEYEDWKVSGMKERKQSEMKDDLCESKT